MAKATVENVKCRECGSGNTIKVGIYRTKRWGLRKRLKCKDCATTFYEDYKSMEEEEK